MISNKIKIGITCVGSLIGQGIIKSIQQCDLADKVEMIGFEYLEGSAGSYWIDKTYIMPDIWKESVSHEDYISELIFLIKKENIKILFVGMGFELKMMAENRSRIENETGCIVIVSSTEVIDIGEDKYNTYKLLKYNGIPYPQTWLPEEINDVLYPAVLKPRTGTGSKGVFTVKNKDELIKRIPELNNPVIQENIGTKDVEYTCGILFLDDEVRTRICLRRYLKDGNTNIAYNSKDVPEGIFTYVEKIAKALKPFGPANFQLRLNENNEPRLFEINARFSGTTSMRPLFGINEVEYIIKYLLKMPLPVFHERYGRIVRYLENIFEEE
jgi:carbamoyl-phosphate synthase large subunit